MIDRKADIRAVRTALRRSRVIALLGPRQCGKTTLAREFVPPGSLDYFDLESPASLARLAAPDELRVIYPGASRYPLGEGVEVAPLSDAVAAGLSLRHS